MENNENFDVIVASSPDEETVILTADQLANNRMDEILRSVVATYDPENKQFSAFLSDKNSSETLTVDRIDELAKNPQTSLNNLLTINACIQTYINKDDLIGITFDAIEANVNTEFKCSYKKYPEQRNKTKAVENARAIVDDFFDQIDAKKIIRSAIPITFAEGNYIMCLRHKDENWIVDYYPLGVAEISDYTSNGRPIVLINIQKLKDALSKTMLKDKKRQPLFFNTQDEEVEANYPPEVYEAYKNNDTYAKLDVDMTGVLRIGNIGRKYGVSPFLRALKPALMLETFDTADRTNAKARNKKIIVQYAGVANLSDYFEQFVKVKEGEFAKAIPNYEGEMYGTDQYDDSVVESAVDKYLAVGTDGKWKVASASISSCYKLAGFQADGVNKIAQIVKLADAGQNS